MKNNIGKRVSYITNGSDGTNYRQATIINVEFHELLGKNIYILKSDYGNVFKLTEREIENIY